MSGPKRIEALGNDVLFFLAHQAMLSHCDCGYHSDVVEEHGPSAWTDRPCAWRKAVTRSSNHQSLLQSTRERGPLLTNNDQGVVLHLPPGSTAQDLADFRAFQASKKKALEEGKGQ